MLLSSQNQNKFSTVSLDNRINIQNKIDSNSSNTNDINASPDKQLFDFDIYKQNSSKYISLICGSIFSKNKAEIDIVVAGDEGGRIIVWNSQNNEVIYEFDCFSKIHNQKSNSFKNQNSSKFQIVSLTLSSSETSNLYGLLSDQGFILQQDLNQGEFLRKWKTVNKRPETSLVVSRNNLCLATASTTILLQNLNSEVPYVMCKLKGHSSKVSIIEFSNDDRFLVSASSTYIDPCAYIQDVSEYTQHLITQPQTNSESSSSPKSLFNPLIRLTLNSYATFIEFRILTNVASELKPVKKKRRRKSDEFEKKKQEKNSSEETKYALLCTTGNGCANIFEFTCDKDAKIISNISNDSDNSSTNTTKTLEPKTLIKVSNNSKTVGQKINNMGLIQNSHFCSNQDNDSQSGKIILVRDAGVVPIFEIKSILDEKLNFIENIILEPVQPKRLLSNKSDKIQSSFMNKNDNTQAHIELAKDQPYKDSSKPKELDSLHPDLIVNIERKDGNLNKHNLLKANFDQMNVEVSADSMTELLVQALQADDKEMLVFVLDHSKETLVSNTVRRLPENFVLKFLHKLIQHYLSSNAQMHCLKIFKQIDSVFITHSSYLVTIPDLPRQLQTLYQTLGVKLSVFDKLLRLNGRLNSVVKQIELTSLLNKKSKENFQVEDSNKNSNKKRKINRNSILIMNEDDIDDKTQS